MSDAFGWRNSLHLEPQLYTRLFTDPGSDTATMNTMRGAGRGRALMTLAMSTAACGCDSGVDVPPNDAMLVDAAPPLYTGSLLLVEEKRSGSNVTTSVGGFVQAYAMIDGRDAGPCRVTRQTKMSASAFSAGTLTISGAATGTVELQPDPQKTYVDESPGFLYGANELLTISASGADVPAFTTAVTFPASLSVSGTTSISNLSKSGVTAAWTSAAGETVHLSITQYPDSVHSLGIDCAFPGEAGTGNVPASALSDLMTGMPARGLISSQTSTESMAGPYEMTVLAAVFGFSGSAVVQP